MAINQQKINQLMTAIVNNTTSLISSHNNNNTAHLDIRTDISGKEDNTNKTTTLSSSSTNTQYPSAKCVYDYIEEVIGEAIDYINR